jgi:prepilin-type N-terminal cleavage/methylation domain-containing protein
MVPTLRHQWRQQEMRVLSNSVNHHNFLKYRGFTLLELLVVVSILSAVAFIAAGTFRGASEQANDGLVRVEMQVIAKAIRQFKQDTGYYPKTGPFDLDNAVGVPHVNLPSDSGSNDTARERWFYSPANFYQLLTATSPLVGTGHQLEAWDPETGRGWRGPYLQGYQDGYLDIRDGINDGTWLGDITGDPLSGNNITDVVGIADPFDFRSVVVGGDTLMDWSTTSGGAERDKWGRPYLFIDLDSGGSVVQMGLISMGADGELGTDDDIKLKLD